MKVASLLFAASGTLALVGLAVPALHRPPALSSSEAALARLEQHLLPPIEVESPDPSGSLATAAAQAPIPEAERLPAASVFPLYAVDPERPPPAGRTRLEIVSSLEKADGEKPDRRWLVEVAERFNRLPEAQGGAGSVEVAVRTIPSGLALQMLVAGRLRPAGFTPAGQQWLDLLRHQGIATTPLGEGLLANHSVIALRPEAWKRATGQPLPADTPPSFGALVEQTLAGRLRVGYSNPYISTPALDFLHTLLWLSAGHGGDGRPLSRADLGQEAIRGSFGLFQQRMAATTPTYLELIETWKRQPERFDAAVMAAQSFRRLRREPGFGDLVAVPFGNPQGSPLAALPWTSAVERRALERFARFARSPAMQELARRSDFGASAEIPAAARPPQADGAVLAEAQRLWKQRKDGGRTVYLQLLIDTSGSMNDHQRLSQLKKALTQASGAINSGNQVGLISFSDHPVRHLPLQPIDGAGRRRLLATVNSLEANGSTALYDGLAVAMADLLRARQRDPNGRFHLLLLSDGERTSGLSFDDLREVIRSSGITITPIAYGEVNQNELKTIAALRESVVYQGTPQRIVPLLNDLFQTNL